MVIGAFPVAKLGVLAIKQISKPIANVLKTRAKVSSSLLILIKIFHFKTLTELAVLQDLGVHAASAVLQLVRGVDKDVGDESGKADKSSKSKIFCLHR